MAGRTQTKVIREHQRAERADFVSLLLDLDPEDWQKPTPCPGWTVADVAAHVLAWEQLLAGANLPERWKRTVRLLVLATTSRFNVDRINHRLQTRSSDEPNEIVAALVSQDISNWKSRFDQLSPGAQLAEYVIHNEDVRAATQRPRDIPAERLDLAIAGVRQIPSMPARSAPLDPELTRVEVLLHLAGR